MNLPTCSSCWGTIQPDEERTRTPSTGIPAFRHTDTAICELLQSEDAASTWRVDIDLPRIPIPEQYPDYAA